MADNIFYGKKSCLHEPFRAFYTGGTLWLSDDLPVYDEYGEDCRTVFDLPRNEAVRLAKWILEQEKADG